MTSPLDNAKRKEIQQADAEQRYKHFLKEIAATRKIWILTDDQGSVMLNTDDEDCVPVWPDQEFAEIWATDEWDGCKAESISINKWRSRWTYGLEDDGFSVVVFPVENADGLVVSPEELDSALEKASRR